MLFLEVVVGGDMVDRLQEESSRKAYVQALLANGYLQDAAEGIAKLFLDKGEDALKGGQIPVFRDRVLGDPHGKTCRFCGAISDWDEQVFVIEDRDGYCSDCRRKMDKD